MNKFFFHVLKTNVPWDFVYSMLFFSLFNFRPSFNSAFWFLSLNSLVIRDDFFAHMFCFRWDCHSKTCTEFNRFCVFLSHLLFSSRFSISYVESREIIFDPKNETGFHLLSFVLSLDLFANRSNEKEKKILFNVHLFAFILLLSFKFRFFEKIIARLKCRIRVTCKRSEMDKKERNGRNHN